MITDEQKRAHPQQRARVGESRESWIFQLRRARYNRREVPHAGHEIADHERPMPDPVEPVMHPADLLVANMQQPAGARMQKLPPQRAPDDVAAGDAAHASSERARKRWNARAAGRDRSESRSRSAEIHREPECRRSRAPAARRWRNSHKWRPTGGRRFPSSDDNVDKYAAGSHRHSTALGLGCCGSSGRRPRRHRDCRSKKDRDYRIRRSRAQTSPITSRKSLPDPESYLAECAAASERLAWEALREVVAEARRRKKAITGCVDPAGLLDVSLPVLANILASHPLIHTAEGEFFRQCFPPGRRAVEVASDRDSGKGSR